MSERLAHRDSQKLNEARQLHINGDLQNARRLYDRLLRKYPRSPSICSLLGALLVDQGQSAKALPVLRTALSKDQNNADIHYNLGLAHAESGDHAAALPHYRQAVALHPSHSKAHYNLGLSLRRLDAHEEAIHALQNDYQLAPSFDTCRLLTKSFLQLEQYANAVHYARHCVELEGAEPRDLDNLVLALCRMYTGTALLTDPEVEELTTLAEHAVRLDSQSPTAKMQLGLAYSMLGNFSAAEEPLRQAMQLNPEDETLQTLLSLSLLTQGKLAEGWHARTLLERMRKPVSDSGVPRWQGELRQGLKLWLQREQGIGDQLLYAGMLPDLIHAGVDVTLVCEAREQPILAASFPAINFVTELNSADQRHYDAFATMGELHLHLRRQLTDIPAPEPYLAVDTNLRDQLRQRYAQLYPHAEPVALAWRSHSEINGAGKSLNLDQLLPVLKLPNKVFVCAQYGPGAEELKQHALAHDYLVHFDEDLDITADLTAATAQLAACSRCVLASNASAHLAGGAGLETHVLVGLRPVWHWFEATTLPGQPTDTPWYANVTLHRQTTLADWQQPVADIAAALGHIQHG